MMNFTQSNFSKKTFQLLIMLMLFGSTLLNAQTHTLTVNSPAGVAGDYPAQIAGFGPVACEVPMVAGDLLIVSDTAMSSRGCGGITTDLTGKIAVIDRGTCAFVEKVANAQQQGAIAVVVVNNTTGLFTMSGTDPSITIPSFMITQADGNKIKTALGDGVNVTITRNDVVDESTDEIVWGNNPGEGDFDGGLNGWTSVNNSCFGSTVDTFTTWKWVEYGFAGGGAYGSGTVTSPTYCNGAAAFESDYYDNGGVAGNFGDGPCAAPQYGELLSPDIDVSSVDGAGFKLKFYQSTRKFTNSQYFVSWSKDGGSTWVDTVEINADYIVNDSTYNNVVQVPLNGTAGASTIRVKFIYNANYYYWIIDDVKIATLEANNLQVNAFFAVPPNAATPLAHVEPFGFLSDIQNIGAADQTNVNLNVTIQDTGGNTVFTADRSYGTVPGGALIENRPFAETYTPTAVGGYYGAYTITADSADYNLDNNTQQFAFVVTDDLFSKDLTGPTNATRPSDAGWSDNEPHSWAWGAAYYVPNAAGNYVQSVSFAIQPEDQGSVGKDLLISMYKWVDADNDQVAQPAERTLVAFNNYTITGTESFTNLINIPLPNPQDDPVQLEDNTMYLVMVEYIADDQSNVFISYNDEIDYSATVAVLGDSLGMPRYAGVLGVGGDLFTTDYFMAGFNGSAYSSIPVVRLQVGANPNSTKDLQTLANKFYVFPNPTSNALNLQLNLDKTATNATVRLFDISGRMLKQWNYDHVQQDRFQYQLGNLSSGTYFIQLITDQGAGTKKIVVKK